MMTAGLCILALLAGWALGVNYACKYVEQAFTTNHDEDHEHIHGTPL